MLATDVSRMFAILIPVYVFLILPAIAVLAGDTQDFLARSAKVQWGLWLTVYALSNAPALLLLKDIPGYHLPPAMLRRRAAATVGRLQQQWLHTPTAGTPFAAQPPAAVPVNEAQPTASNRGGSGEMWAILIAMCLLA